MVEREPLTDWPLDLPLRVGGALPEGEDIGGGEAVVGRSEPVLPTTREMQPTTPTRQLAGRDGRIMSGKVAGALLRAERALGVERYWDMDTNLRCAVGVLEGWTTPNSDRLVCMRDAERVMEENDNQGPPDETGEERCARMAAWIEANYD
jgi:hypothetical protein